MSTEVESLNFNTLYEIDGKYYYIVLKPSKKSSKSFTTQAAADTYFAANPTEIYNGSRYYIDSTALKNKDLYEYKYSERKPGATIYSTADGKLYKLFGISSDNIEEIDFQGRLEIVDGEARIYLYDQAWTGYDEQADKDDFILYNTYHTVEYMNHSGTINRPIKSVCDAEFDTDNYGKDGVVDVSSSIIKSYVGTSADLITASELYKFNDEGRGVGLVSAIEYYTQFKNDSKINYYSSVAEFFIDYYRYIIKNINCYENGIKFPYAMYWDDENEKYIVDKDETYSTKIAAANETIKEKFDKALYNLKIIKDFITNKSYFTIISSSTIYSVSELEAIEKYLDSASSTEQKKNVKKYNSIRSAVVNVIENSYTSTSMKVVYGSDETKYTYSGTEDISGILLSKINLSVYGDQSYSLSYKLIFTEGSYNQDYFGEYLDCYSKFANIYDIFMSDIDTSTFTSDSCDFTKYKSGCDASTRKAKIESFLKYIYYSKMVELYREKFFEESMGGLSIDDQNANDLTSKLTETLDGKGGNLMLTSTLSSLKENNGGKNDKIVKIPFEICTYTTSSSGTEFKFYIRKDDMIRTSGMMFNEELEKFLAYNTDLTYSMTNESGGTSIVYDYTLRRKAIEAGYAKKVAVIKPVFFNDNSGETYKLFEEGKLKAGSYFNINIRKLVEKDHDDITISNFPTMDFSSVTSFQDFVEYTKPSNWMLSIKDKTEYYVLSYKDESITTELYPDFVPVSLGSDDSSSLTYLESHDTNEGYIEINNVDCSLIDNYISVPQSRDWVDVNAVGDKDEFISFGDDREINVEVDNKYFDKDTDSAKENAFDTYISSLSDSSNKAVLSVKDEDGNVGDYKYYNRSAIKGQYNLSYTYTEGEASGKTDSKGNATYKVPFDEEQEYKVGNEDKKDYRDKIYETAAGDVLLETSSLFMGNVTSVTLIYNIIYMKLKPYNMKSWFIVKKAKNMVMRALDVISTSLNSKIKSSMTFGILFGIKNITMAFKGVGNESSIMRGLKQKALKISFGIPKTVQDALRLIKVKVAVSAGVSKNSAGATRELNGGIKSKFNVYKKTFKTFIRSIYIKNAVLSFNIYKKECFAIKSITLNEIKMVFNIIPKIETMRTLNTENISDIFYVLEAAIGTGFELTSKNISSVMEVLKTEASEGFEFSSSIHGSVSILKPELTIHTA